MQLHDGDFTAMCLNKNQSCSRKRGQVAPGNWENNVSYSVISNINFSTLWQVLLYILQMKSS